MRKITFYLSRLSPKKKYIQNNASVSNLSSHLNFTCMLGACRECVVGLHSRISPNIPEPPQTITPEHVWDCSGFLMKINYKITQTFILRVCSGHAHAQDHACNNWCNGYRSMSIDSNRCQLILIDNLGFFLVNWLSIDIDNR